MIHKNCLHYYVDLLRMEGDEERSSTQTKVCVAALHNVIRTMKMSRHDMICDEDFSRLDFGNIPLNGIHFSKDGEQPCRFDKCRLNEWNFMSGHTAPISFIIFSSCGRYVLSTDDSGISILWDINTGLQTYKVNWNSESNLNRIIKDLLNEEDEILRVTYDNDRLSIITQSRALCQWNVSDDTFIAIRVVGNEYDILNFKYNDDNILICIKDNALVLYNIDSQEEQLIMKDLFSFLNFSVIWNLYFSEDNNYLIVVGAKYVSSATAEIRIVNLKEQMIIENEIMTYVSTDKEGYSISKNGKYFLRFSNDIIIIYDLFKMPDKGIPIIELDNIENVYSAFFPDSDKYIIITTHDEKVLLYNIIENKFNSINTVIDNTMSVGFLRSDVNQIALNDHYIAIHYYGTGFFVCDLNNMKNTYRYGGFISGYNIISSDEHNCHFMLCYSNFSDPQIIVIDKTMKKVLAQYDYKNTHIDYMLSRNIVDPLSIDGNSFIIIKDNKIQLINIIDSKNNRLLCPQITDFDMHFRIRIYWKTGSDNIFVLSEDGIVLYIKNNAVISKSIRHSLYAVFKNSKYYKRGLEYCYSFKDVHPNKVWVSDTCKYLLFLQDDIFYLINTELDTVRIIKDYKDVSGLSDEGEIISSNSALGLSDFYFMTDNKHMEIKDNKLSLNNNISDYIYLINALHIKNVSFHNIIANDTTRKILYQYNGDIGADSQ